VEAADIAETAPNIGPAVILIDGHLTTEHVE
jgi:hypothetical protein